MTNLAIRDRPDCFPPKRYLDWSVKRPKVRKQFPKGSALLFGLAIRRANGMLL